MVSLMHSFNVVYRDEDNRGFFKTRAIALMLTVLLALTIFVSVVLLIVGDGVMQVVNEWHIIREGWIINLVNLSLIHI